MRKVTAAIILLAILIISGCNKPVDSSAASSHVSSVILSAHSTATSSTQSVISQVILPSAPESSAAVSEISGDSVSVTASSEDTAQTVLPEKLFTSTGKIFLYEGQSAKISTSVYPADALGSQLIWSSSDSSVASVSVEKDGVIKYMAPGTAIITCSTLLGGLSESCQVICLDLCTTKQQLIKVIINALEAGKSNISVNLSSTEIIPEPNDIDRSQGAAFAEIGDRIIYENEGVTTSAYIVNFNLVPAFASYCHNAIATGDYSECSTLQLSTCTAAQEYVAAQPDGQSEYRIAKNIHDFIISRNAYTHSSPDEVFSETVAFGVLCDRMASADGLADAFNLLAGCMGLESRTVVGYAENGERHAWNTVKIDGQWYHIDLAADSIPELNYDFFLVGGKKMQVPYTFSSDRLVAAPNDYTGAID